MKILFVAPHAGIWVHAFPEALVAESLTRGGHDVLYLGCRGIMRTQCVTHFAYKVYADSPENEREAVCRRCRHMSELIQHQFGFNRVDIEDLVGGEDKLQIEQSLASVNRDNFLDFQYKGLPVGRFALYQVLLLGKKLDFDFTDREWEIYRGDLKGCLYVLAAVGRLLDREKFDSLVTSNSLYGVHQTAAVAAESRGVPSYSLHAGPNISDRLQTLSIARRDHYVHYAHLKKLWVDYRNLPCDVATLRYLSEHLIEVMRARSIFAYSSTVSGKFDLRRHFEVSSGQRVLLAVMSSYDERFAAEAVDPSLWADKPVFPKQVDWIKAVVELVSARPDLFLIIRVHPRDFPNKRDRQLSDHARQLAAVFSQLPKNVAVNWPDEGLSLYDLAADVDVVLNGWSSAGKEMAMLGIPVVVYAPKLIAYAPDLNFVGETRGAYIDAIDEALKSGWSFERVRATYRWLALEQRYAAVNIGDAFARRETGLSPRRIWTALSRRVGSFLPERWECLRRPSSLLAARKICVVFENRFDSVADMRSSVSASPQEETAALRAELARLASALHLRRRPESILGRAMLAIIDGKRAA